MSSAGKNKCRRSPTQVTDDSDSADEYYHDCYSWANCGFGYLCTHFECRSALEPADCVHDSLVEIPLPELEPALAITLADLDGDGDDEIVSVGATAISVIFADDSIVLTPLPETQESKWVTALELQGNDSLDLAVGSATNIVLLGGTGDGGFVHLATHELLPELAVASALDPDGDGVDQLVGAQTNAGSLTWVPDVAAGTWNPLSQHTALTLTIGNVWGTNDSPPEILADRDCALRIIDSTNFDNYHWLAGALGWRCEWHAAFVGHGTALFSVTTDAETPSTQLNVFTSTTLTGGSAAMVPGLRATTSTLVNLQDGYEPVLALGSDSSLALVWGWSRQFPSPCIEHLDGAADSLHAGDRDGDGREELAVLREGTIRLRHLP